MLILRDYLKSNIGLFLGLVAFIFFLTSNYTSNLTSDIKYVIAIATLMIIWWIAEAMPVAVTALLPIILFPIFGVLEVKQVTASYGHPIVFMFFGGFMLALAMQKWNLHLRIALSIIRFTGSDPIGVLTGFMIATAFLSMWMSNTATTVMMFPIAYSVMQLYKEELDEKNYHNIAIALMLAIAFSANIGGVATLIGTPPNAIMAGYVSTQYNYNIEFFKWMMVGLPFSISMLIICRTLFIYLFRLKKIEKVTEVKDIIKDKKRSLGKMQNAEILISFILGLVVALWVFKPFIPAVKLNDTTIAIIGVLLLFLLPTDKTNKNFILEWKDTAKIPWGVLLLFGGGLSIAGAMKSSGLIDLIGNNISTLYDLGFVILLAIVILLVLFMTECMSNMAVTTVIMPIVAVIAIKLGVSPFIFIIAATMASSCAFMLPMATPPNAIVFASGQMHISDMMKAGIILNVISAAIVYLIVYFLVPYIFTGLIVN